MAVSVLACLFFICILPCFANSCNTTLPCDPSIQIKPPFYLQSDPSCHGSLGVGCGNSFPVLLWQLSVLQLESISYNPNTIRAQDFYLNSSLKNSSCGNLYFNFSSPVKFNNEMYNLLSSSLSSVRCEQYPNKIESPPKIFGKDYNLSYSPSLDEDDKSRQNCSNKRPDSSLHPSFEFIFSFENDSPELSLQSANYSGGLVAQPGCFAYSTEVFDQEDRNSTEVSNHEDVKGKHTQWGIIIGCVVGFTFVLAFGGLLIFFYICKKPRLISSSSKLMVL